MFVLNPYASDFFLGEGSHSKVFAAELHEGEDVRKIALKVMKSEDTITEDMLTEMRCMSKLIDSPHVVQLQKFKFPKDDSIKVSSFKRKLSQLAIECPFVKQVHNSFCIAMEQMDTSVHVLLYDKDHLETLSFPMILSWIKQLLLALSDCHKKGIIHRDVKPHNLLVNRDRSILKLSDFSIAKEQKAKRSKKLVEDELVTPQMVTLFYRAPEILKGSVDYSYATDIWSNWCRSSRTLSAPRRTRARQRLPRTVFLSKSLFFERSGPGTRPTRKELAVPDVVSQSCVLDS